MLLALWLTLATDAAKLVFADKYDAAFAEAAARNVPVLIVDFDGWTTDLKQGQPIAFYEDKEFCAAAEGAVLILASQEDHGSKKEEIDGETRDVCAKHGGTTCDAHRDMLPKLFTDFGRDGQIVSPLFIVATPERKELIRHEQEQRPAEMVLALKEAVKKLGPGMPRGDYVKVERGLKELRRLTELGEFASAVAALDQLRKIPGSFAPQTKIKVAEQKLDEAGRSKVQRAQELWSAGRQLEGLLAMDDVKGSFGKLAAAATAAVSVAEWEKSAEIKPHLATLKSHRAARQLYQQAVELERARDVKRAVQTLDKLLKQYPDSAFSERARTMAASLKSEKDRSEP